jgi:hypothetical protein
MSCAIILTIMVKYRKNEIATDPAPELWAIFERLENGRKTEQSKRVGRILELLSSLGQNPRGLEAANVTSELWHLLGRFRWVSRAHISRTAEGYRAIFRRVPEEEHLSHADKWEYDAVANLLEITDQPGALSRLRQCGNPECRRWLFTPKGKTRQFCDNKNVCKQRAFDSDPEQRETKRVYMSKRYEDEKTRKLNPKCGVGLRQRRPQR